MRVPAALAICLLLAAGCASPAQTATGTLQLGGRIMNGDGTFAAHAKAFLDPGGLQKTADGSGYVLFTGLAPGSYTLRFEPENGPAFSVVEKLDGNRTDEMFMPGAGDGSSRQE